MSEFYAVDLFCGAGGLSLGLTQAGFTIKLANEIDPIYAKTYQTNHKDAKIIIGDIKGLDFKSIHILR